MGRCLGMCGVCGCGICEDMSICMEGCVCVCVCAYVE